MFTRVVCCLDCLQYNKYNFILMYDRDVSIFLGEIRVQRFLLHNETNVCVLCIHYEFFPFRAFVHTLNVRFDSMIRHLTKGERVFVA